MTRSHQLINRVTRENAQGRYAFWLRCRATYWAYREAGHSRRMAFACTAWVALGFEVF